MGAKAGWQAKLYYKVGGHKAVGEEWTELDDVRDLTLDTEAGTADATTRANGGWRAKILSLMDSPVNFSMVHDPDDTGYAAIQDAFVGRANIGLAIVDGDIATGNGLQADFIITKFTRSEALEDAILRDVTAEIAYSADPPEWIEAGATASA